MLHRRNTTGRSINGEPAPRRPKFSLDENFNVGLNLSIPLFNRNLRNIDRQTAIIQQQQLELSRANTERTIESDVKNAVLDVVNEIANIELSRVSEESARQSLELTQTAYLNGSVNLVQLIDAQNNLLQAQIANANASYTFLLTALLLERYIGHYFLLNDESENEAFRLRFLDYLSNLPE